MLSLILIGSWLHQSSNPLLCLVTEKKKANTLYLTTLNLVLQALCLLLLRFCTDPWVTHMAASQMPPWVWCEYPNQSRCSPDPLPQNWIWGDCGGKKLVVCEDGYRVVAKEGLGQSQLVNVWRIDIKFICVWFLTAQLLDLLIRQAI